MNVSLKVENDRWVIHKEIMANKNNFFFKYSRNTKSTNSKISFKLQWEKKIVFTFEKWRHWKKNRFDEKLHDKLCPRKLRSISTCNFFSHAENMCHFSWLCFWVILELKCLFRLFVRWNIKDETYQPTSSTSRNLFSSQFFLPFNLFLLNIKSNQLKKIFVEIQA